MHIDIARSRLKDVPATVLDTLLTHRDSLPAGAITVVNLFFQTLKSRGEHPSAPTRGTFERTCKSESTLALLLRVLATHAPMVCLSEGRVLRKEYYLYRPGGSQDPNRSTPLRQKRVETAPRNWPSNWLELMPGLSEATVKESTRSQYIASVNSCAALLPKIKSPPRFGWLLAMELAREMGRVHPAEGKTAVNPRTAANYIGGLIGLAKHGGLEKAAVSGMQAVQRDLLRKGKRLPKRKDVRLVSLHEAGGYGRIMQAIVQNLEDADAMPDWTAEAATRRATAAVLAICVNEPARTGDVSQWTLGEQLIRTPWGIWQLDWKQEKTGNRKHAGELWPEIGKVLDEHILGGRPERHIHRRYEELCGCNWLSQTPKPYDRRWPSERVADAIGVPLHDLRTLCSDYLRQHDPVAAPRIVSVVLGHRSQESGKDYTSECSEPASQREWQSIRDEHLDNLPKGERKMYGEVPLISSERGGLTQRLTFVQKPPCPTPYEM
jgi:hypothetical protein